MEWTKEQIEYLKEFYPILGKNQCVKNLGLKECQVRYKASKLGLKINHNSKLLNYDPENKRGKYFKGKKRPEHSKLMKKLLSERDDLGFKKVERKIVVTNCLYCEKEITSKVVPSRNAKLTCNNKCYVNYKKEKMKTLCWKTHPKGMTNKKHSKKFKQDMSNRVKKEWEDKDSSLNSEQRSQKISDSNVQLHKNGILGGNNTYSSSKRGWFVDGDKKYYMRSSWEIRYAAFLNILQKGKAIKKWEYEVDTFWFENIKRGVRSYKPDFKVFNNDGSFEYHEVKGWMDAKSKTKLKRMKKYYPEIKVVIKDNEFFKKNINIIPSYESAISMYS